MAMTECAWCLGALNKDAEGMWGGCTRDDLIRLVVGMQWREAVFRVYSDEFINSDKSGMWLRDRDDGEGRGETPTASDIVDEWLGVK
jgi:hypothetical protein